MITDRRQAIAALGYALDIILSSKALPINPKVKRVLTKTMPAARKAYARYKKHYKQTEALPPEVAALIEAAQTAIAALTAQLEADSLTVAEWESGVQEILAQNALTAAMLGAGSEAYGAEVEAALSAYLDYQYSFLSDFAAEIGNAAEWAAGWNARAQNYALSLKVPYWNGETDYLPLPAMPAEGTQCQNNCYCKWRVDEVDAPNGDFDCYWILEDGVDHCQTCKQRAEDWNPIQIRNWELQ